MLPPSQIGPWRPLRLLGQGAMAAVWLCVDSTGAEAAVKWLDHASPAMVARFFREIEVLARIDHPGVVRLLGRGVEGGRPWLAMEALPGADLREYAEKLRRRPPRERIARTRTIARQVGEALDSLHRIGIVHRDIKPQNILLDARGNAVLTDLGIAAWTDEGGGSSLVGTAAYASPEAIRGEAATPSVDQYGLGCTLYHLLTGRRPFDGDTARLLRAHLDERPRPPSELDPTVPPDLDARILRMLEKLPTARFPDVASAVRGIEEGADEGIPLAGRQAVVDTIAAALDDVAAGTGVVLRLTGNRGAGRAWCLSFAAAAALRRELVCVATQDADQAAEAEARIAGGEALLLITPLPGAGQRVRLEPLGLGDVRRTVYSFAPRTPRFAEQAERLHRLSGGNARLLSELLLAHTQDEVFALPEAPTVDDGPFLDPLDLDALAVATALALLHAPADTATLSRLAQAPADEVLPQLVHQSVAIDAGQGWRLGAEVLREPILARSPDVDAIRQRMAPDAVAAPADPVREAARALRLQGKWQEARRMLETASAVGGVAGAERALLLGFVRWQLGDLEGAAESYSLASLVPGPASIRARASIGVGIVSLLTGRLADAMDRFSEAATEASIARDPVRESVAWLDLCEARAVSGQLAGALDAGRRAVRLAAGAGDREIECAAMRHLGQALLDVGAVDEAYRILADATALARALSLEDERIATHTLRARATLDARPRDRAAAASALDRVLPLLSVNAPDPEGFSLLVRAVWARATAQLGDTRTYRRAVQEADPARAGARITVRLRAELELLRAHLLAGELDVATERGTRLVAEADTIGAMLLSWEARRLLARANGGPLPSAEPLALGLDDAMVRALQAR